METKPKYIGDEKNVNPPNEVDLIAIGTRVMVIPVNVEGVIESYNKSKSGLYPGHRYPYIVKRDDGHRFEYSGTDLNQYYETNG